MAIQVLTDVVTYIGGNDMTADMNSVALTYGAEMLDDTVFGDDTRSNDGGLKTIQFQEEGLWDAANADSPDRVLFDEVGSTGTPISLAPLSSTATSVAYFFNAASGEYSPGGEVGELLRFSISAEGADGDRVVNGQIEAAKAARTTSGNSTGTQLGAVSSTQRLYAALHVFSSSGAGDQTLSVKVTSDSTSGFTSTLDQSTFTQVTTAKTAEIVSSSGPISDDWFRAEWTVAGSSNPGYTFAVELGIQ